MTPNEYIERVQKPLEALVAQQRKLGGYDANAEIILRLLEILKLHVEHEVGKLERTRTRQS